MKAKKRRSQVLSCAAELFAERGYHQTTVDHIVKRAAIARGTFYLYFKDKRSIFEELLDTFLAALRERIIRIDPSLGRERCLLLMRQNIRGVIEVCLQHRALSKILLSEAVGLDSDFAAKLLEFDGEATTLLQSSLFLGQQMGVVRSCQVPVVAIFIYGALKELMYQVVMNRIEVGVEEAVEQMLSLYLEGLFILPDSA